MNNELFHAYFLAFKKIGENTLLRIHRLQGTETLEIHDYDHKDYDGVSAIVHLAGKRMFTPPLIRFTPKPSLWKQLKGLLRWYLRFFPFKWAHWREKPASTRVAAWTTFAFDKDMSSFDLNAKLLLALDRASRSRLSSNKPRMWMMPAGLYEKIERGASGNKVSFIDVKISDDTTTNDIKSSVRADLKAMVHWGTLLLLKPVIWFGVDRFAKYLETAHKSFKRTGTLTNMGEWKIAGLPEDEWWTFGDGMVALMNPLVGTAMIINGKLGVSLIAHPSLGFSKSEMELFLTDWKREFSL